MAEVLGLAASIIAVVDVAAKTGNAYVKIQRLWNEVKNVPDLLREKAEDIQIFEDFLANVDENLANSPLPALASDRILLEKLIGRCRSVLQELRDTVDRIYSRVTSERGLKHRIASVKAALRKDELETLSLKFDRALRMFQMAQAEERRRIAVMTYNAIIQSNTNSLLSSTTRTTSSEIIQQPSEIKRNVQSEIWLREGQKFRETFSECSNLSIFGKFRFRNEEQGGFHTVVALPSWLSNSTYSILAQKANVGWQFSFRAQEVIQKFDEDMRLIIRQDNSKRLMECLQSRRMGLFVHDENGCDLLAVAISYGSLSVIKALTSQGLGVRLGDPFIGWNIIQGLVYSFDDHYYAQAAMVQILGDLGLDDLLEADGLVWALDHGIAFECFERLWRRRTQGPELSFAERSRLLRAIVYHARNEWWTLDQVFVLVSETSFRDEACLVSSRTPGHYSLIHSMAVGSTHPFMNYASAMEQCRWAQTLKDCVRFDPLGLQHVDADLSYDLPGIGPRPSYTPLSAMISQACFKRRDAWKGDRVDFSLELQRMLKFWVNTIASAGIDLLAYGRQERRFHETGMVAKFPGFVSKTYTPKRHHDFGTTLVNMGACRYFIAGFTYGRRPEHWNLWITCENYEYAGDFWDMIDGQAASMPGSWVQDPVDREMENWYWMDRESPPLIWSEYRKIKQPI